jgi:heat shock protein HslJ
MKILMTSLAAGLLGGCVTPPPAPSAAAYHAVGTEPFWGLTIDQRELTFTQPDAQPIRQPRPKVIVGVAGEIYQTPRLHVNIVHAQCSDGMSDRTYPDKVQVDADGRRLEGCGGL